MASQRVKGERSIAQRMDIHKQIGRRIAQIRHEQGRTQEEVAARAGIGAPYLARIEAGSKRPTVETLAAVAGALRVPLWRLFGAKREPPELGAVGELIEITNELSSRDVAILLAVARRLRR